MDAKWDVADIMYSLCIAALSQSGLLDKPEVKRFLRSLPSYTNLDLNPEPDTFRAGTDTLGFIYQSILNEGKRIADGIYYTTEKLTGHLTHNLTIGADKKFLDPCCGSGAFLLSLDTEHPENLYGYDIDPIAVMIATVNLFIKYPSHDFKPNIKQLDFLAHSLFDHDAPDERFDYIYTNPPWGADRLGKYKSDFPEISSGEKASMTILESLKHLSPDGIGCFVLPTSILSTKSHSDIRKIIAQQTKINAIQMLPGTFDGVFTDFFAIKLQNRKPSVQRYIIHHIESTQKEIIELTSRQQKQGEIPFKAILPDEEHVIRKIERIKLGDLSNSIWALGIVTGDNKTKLMDNALTTGYEPIYTGKQISEFHLTGATKYIKFNPSELQQCAPERVYRAPEKLIYRFIAKFPIVAYDDTQSLCLNSANIIIPQIKGISTKSIAAILNSKPYRFYYLTKFSDIKVLKWNLSQIPIPRLTRKDNDALCALTDKARETGFTNALEEELDELMASILGLTDKERLIIEEAVDRLIG